ncbi:DUF4232 domain-containing protein [Pseudonocardia acaciae]|uniref:DUF4232 domain-containing protein n=1 Tax=Pseudonocardia acaciae TaxID=551276 RepID=UPI000687E069|nr:DUF4232 domain-containing protein [Pseudonocardia acaciae]
MNRVLGAVAAAVGLVLAGSSTAWAAPGGVPVGAELTHQQQPGSEILAVTNKGNAPLSLNGWPQLSFLAANNSPVPVPVQQVNQPGAATPTTLQPGQSAFAGVKLVAGPKSSSDVFVATTTKLTVPGAAGPVVVTLIGPDGKPVGYPELSLKSVQVGTFQPVMQGVSPDAW